MMRLAALLLLLALVGCDSGGPADVASLYRVSGVEIAAVQRTTEADGSFSFDETDTLRGIFRFAVGAQVMQTSSGDCAATTSGECQIRLGLRSTPATAELTLDTDIVADGETVPAGEDLRPLLIEEFQRKVLGRAISLNRQVYNFGPPLVPSDNVFFDPARVRVPDGERTLTLSWTMPTGEAFEAITNFEYRL